MNKIKEHSSQNIGKAQFFPLYNTTYQSKLTVTRILIFETQDSILTSWNFRESSLESQESNLECHESKVESSSIMSLSLDWSLKEQIHQTDCFLLKNCKVHAADCNKWLLQSLFTSVVKQKLHFQNLSTHKGQTEWLAKFPTCSEHLKQKCRLFIICPC